jgi:hypothetical protein
MAKDQKHRWQRAVNVRVVRATLHQLHTLLRDEWVQFTLNLVVHSTGQ